MTLRPYQRSAVDAVYDHLRRRDDNPVVVVPTGGGKTPILACIARDVVQTWNGRILILSHVKELVEQSARHLVEVDPALPVGVFSAGLKRRDVGYAATVAGIQSVYDKADKLGRFDVVIVDEAHMIPPDGDGMYRELLRDLAVINPVVRLVGLTATPWRLKGGAICAAENIFNHVCYEIGVRELIVQGYLSPLVSKAGSMLPDLSGVKTRAGEFVAGDAEKAMDADDVVSSAASEIVRFTKDRRSVLVFACGVRHGEHVAALLADRQPERVEFVDAESLDRDGAVRRYRACETKYLVNVGVFTTGFDAPNTDCVVILRPTMSAGLFCQMVGRGLRLAPGKTNCLVLDYGGNILRHGPVDQIAVESVKRKGEAGEPLAKMCPQCRELCACGYARCPCCGYEFPAPQRTAHDGEASSDGILSDEVKRDTYEVLDTYYCVHSKRGAPPDAPRTMRVDYTVADREHPVSEWVCIEHQGYARERAEAWWRLRSGLPIPLTAEAAVRVAVSGGLAVPLEITVYRKAGERFERVVACRLGDRPELSETAETDLDDSLVVADDAPF